MRRCFEQMRGGEVDSIRGYAVTRVHDQDDFVRIDWCIAGFRHLINRLCPEIDTSAMWNVEKKLAAGTPLFAEEVCAANGVINLCEGAMMRHSVKAVKNAVLTEQINIELERIAA